ncbi:glycosyl transferase family 2 [Haloarcula onubensis]|uniref:Glycosyl transferase family 2 n=1 Tax=Haloarcula onubensis TaxID=2950539 RepID=A0ABU2FL70_9EURY|nr:glycosyl transferase family 2 [Halomicroarcula sp. S3CR25-11]MDS0281503.1 glycosyl transferase family 2 [Halomicroarcula sp. S3CR25-11]
MDYLQERITTLHDLTDAVPAMPAGDSAVVVPIAGETEAAVTPTHVFRALEAVGPSAVVVPLRAPRPVAAAFDRWAADFDLDVTTLWCNAPSVAPLLDDHGLDGAMGKGRDVWLGLGLAADRADYVAVHDADASTYSPKHVPRLLAGLDMGYAFVKGYYARVEDGQLYGRLARLFVAPLLRALSDAHDDPLLAYLSAFRYPLAGEFAFTAEAARSIRAQRAWGLEIGMLGEAYDVVGETATAQVDLGMHRHDHRPVGGRGGLSTMAQEVGEALFRVLEDHGVRPDYERLPDAYRDAADTLVRQYGADAAVNALDYDADAERSQVQTYAGCIRAPGPDDRLPPWTETTLSAGDVLEVSRDALGRPGSSPLD